MRVPLIVNPVPMVPFPYNANGDPYGRPSGKIRNILIATALLGMRIPHTSCTPWIFHAYSDNL